MIAFLKTIIYIPLYNIFVLILNIDFVDAGVAAILLTVAVKLILYPLTKKSTLTQIKMKNGERELSSIKEKYKDTQEQALQVMEFYKKNNINPFSSIFALLIQIPIIYSLYHIFFNSGLPEVNLSLLYPFIHAPTSVSMSFLGLIDVSQKSIILAILAAISTFAQAHFSTSGTQSSSEKEDFSKMLASQMKFTLPIIVFFISWRIAGVVALYWIVSNLVGIAQDFYIKKQLKNSLAN